MKTATVTLTIITALVGGSYIWLVCSIFGAFLQLLASE